MYKFLSEHYGVTLLISAGKNPKLQNYEPALFWFDDHGTLWCRANCVGHDIPRNDMDEAEFNKHIDNMVEEGFEITITV